MGDDIKVIGYKNGKATPARRRHGSVKNNRKICFTCRRYKILFDGKGFDGNEANRMMAGGFLLFAIVSGSKTLKAVKFIPTGALKWGKAVVTAGGKSVILKSNIINGIVDFGLQATNNAQLRKILGLVVGDGKHAHHIIPFNFRTSELVQKAARADKRFHISERLNGIPLPSSNHLTGHPAYSDTIEEILIGLNSSGMTPNQAYDKLTLFISYLDDLIRTHPNLNLGEIANLISYP